MIKGRKRAIVTNIRGRLFLLPYVWRLLGKVHICPERLKAMTRGELQAGITIQIVYMVKLSHSKGLGSWSVWHDGCFRRNLYGTANEGN